MEDGTSVLAEREHHALAVRDRLALHVGQECRRFRFVTPPCREQQLRDIDASTAGRVDQRVGLLDQLRGGLELPLEDTRSVARWMRLIGSRPSAPFSRAIRT